MVEQLCEEEVAELLPQSMERTSAHNSKDNCYLKNICRTRHPFLLKTESLDNAILELWLA